MDVPDSLGEEPGDERPDHPHFWRLSEIVLQFDAQVQDGNMDISRFIEKEIDEQSLIYMAIQRSERAERNMAQQHLQEGGSARNTMLAGLMTCYLEGFFLGKRYAERYGG